MLVSQHHLFVLAIVEFKIDLAGVNICAAVLIYFGFYLTSLIIISKWVLGLRLKIKGVPPLPSTQNNPPETHMQRQMHDTVSAENLLI